jgi:hypothetical protein
MVDIARDASGACRHAWFNITGQIPVSRALACLVLEPISSMSEKSGTGINAVYFGYLENRSVT